jgi:hypothetical protein
MCDRRLRATVAAALSTPGTHRLLRTGGVCPCGWRDDAGNPCLSPLQTARRAPSLPAVPRAVLTCRRSTACAAGKRRNGRTTPVTQSLVELDDLKRILQRHFSDDLVTIVGSGLSASLGLPTMSVLGVHLEQAMPRHCDSELLTQWEIIVKRMREAGDLESAMDSLAADHPLLPSIASETASLVLAAEQRAIQSVARGETELAFAQLLPHITFADKCAHVVTSNYDRLIEFAVESENIGLDTGFCGYNYGTFDPRVTRDSLSTFVRPSQRTEPRRKWRTHVKLHKPHGSLDWYLHNGRPVRSVFALDAPRLMITPGASKYRLGYDSPFDYHREAANRAIDSASRFLVIGYGFNDEQLETHLRRKLTEGRPCLLLTKVLTPKGVDVVAQYDSVLSLTESHSGTECRYRGEHFDYPGIRLWNLSSFIREVFQ